MKPPESSGDRALQPLEDSDVILADPNLDIRGRTVVDRHGADVGPVDDLFVDESERKVRIDEIRTGGGFLGIGGRHALVSVDAIAKISKRAVHLNETRERAATIRAPGVR